MNPKQVFAFIIFLIILLIIAVGVSKLSENSLQMNDSAIEEDFGSKIVYSAETTADPTPYQNDCRARGGEFNSCGNICAPKAEICAEVCAYTCEDIESAADSVDVPSGWETYTGTSIDFEMRYHPEMDINPVERGGVNFNMWGPTQVEASEFFDGISLTVREMGIPEEMAVEDFVRDQMNKDHVNPVSGSFRQITIDDRVSFQFTATGEINIPSTYVYIPSSDTTVFEVNYVAEDPTGQGFQDIVDTMLQTMDIHPEIQE